jgi:hypothetical protein
MAKLTDKIKLAAYLDEAGEDPSEGAACVKSTGIDYVVLRSAWGTNVAALSDNQCQSLQKSLVANNLSAIALISDLGKVNVRSLPVVDSEQIKRVFNVAAYFHVDMVRIQVGVGPYVKEPIVAWMDNIQQQAISFGLKPVFEITEDAWTMEPARVATVLSSHKSWRLLYDPVQLIIKRKTDPFHKYWTLLKNSAAAIDLRDYKIGRGYKPVGFGDAQIKATLDDCMNASYKGWYFIEPSLGRRFGSHTTKSETFKAALEALDVLLA